MKIVSSPNPLGTGAPVGYIAPRSFGETGLVYEAPRLRLSICGQSQANTATAMTVLDQKTDIVRGKLSMICTSSLRSVFNLRVREAAMRDQFASLRVVDFSTHSTRARRCQGASKQ